MASYSNRAVIVASSGDLLVAASKFIAAALTGSSAMFSEGVHSLIDCANGALLLIGIRRSKRPPDERHPLGHSRELYFWSLVVAVLFFGLGGVLTIYEGVARIRHPEPLEAPLWNYVSLAFAAAFEGGSLAIAYRQFRKQAGAPPLLQAIRRSRDPSMFTVILEDSAALIGIVAAFLGVFLAHVFERPVFDSAASIVIGAILATVALFLADEIRSLVIGESADREVIQIIREIAAHDPAVEGSNPPLAVYIGPEDLVVALELQFRPDINADELTRAVDRIEGKIRERFPIVRQIFVEAESIARQTRPVG